MMHEDASQFLDGGQSTKFFDGGEKGGTSMISSLTKEALSNSKERMKLGSAIGPIMLAK